MAIFYWAKKDSKFILLEFLKYKKIFASFLFETSEVDEYKIIDHEKNEMLPKLNAFSVQSISVRQVKTWIPWILRHHQHHIKMIGMPPNRTGNMYHGAPTSNNTQVAEIHPASNTSWRHDNEVEDATF